MDRYPGQYLPMFLNDKMRSQTPIERKTNRREFLDNMRRKKKKLKKK